MQIFHNSITFNSLYKQNYKTNDIRGRYISEGAEGQVFNLKNSKNKVIKIFSIGESWVTPLSYKKTLKAVIEHPQPNIAKIFDIGVVNFDGHKSYYYVAEKLHKLNGKESLFVDENVDIENNLKDIVSYEQKYNKLYNFIKKLHKNKMFEVSDLHSGNIMKNKNGNYKLCDLGSVELKRKYSKMFDVYGF